MRLPLVSCIMPTKNRREFVPKAIEYFLRQTYPNKELVIGDDGEPVHDLIDTDAVERTDAIVHYRQFKPGQTLGAKRNALVEACTGDSLIAHWDDDDWYGPERLADQVTVMCSRPLGVCGVDSPLFYDLRTGKSYHYQFASECLYGATLMYTREFWQRRPFSDTQVGESGAFLDGRTGSFGVNLGDWFVGMIHDGNTVPKAIHTRYYMPYPDLALSFGADWPFYQSLREKMGVAA